MRRIRLNSTRSAWAANHWQEVARDTTSTLESGSVVRSAAPSTLRNRGFAPHCASASRRLALVE
jgi:hypothetical protein